MPSTNINFFLDGTAFTAAATTTTTVSNSSFESPPTCRVQYIDTEVFSNNPAQFKLVKFTESEYSFLKAYIRAVYFNLFDIDFYINSVNLMLCLNHKKYKDFYLLKLTDSEIWNMLKLFNTDNIHLKKNSSIFLKSLVFSPQRRLVKSLLESSIYSDSIEIEE